MAGKPNLDELDLTDAELIQVLKNHGMNRRLLMKVFGAGAVVSALGGTATGKKSGGAKIDDIYGASFFMDERPPSGLIDHTVELHAHFGGGPPEFFFDPVGLQVEPGDVVEFKVHGPVTHTATSFHPHFEALANRIPQDNPYTSPPITGIEGGFGDSWLYRFSSKGIHDIACLPHFEFGMVMRIVVFDPKKDSLDDATFDEYGPMGPHPVFDVTEANNVLTDDALDPENIVAEGEVPWDNL